MDVRDGFVPSLRPSGLGPPATLLARLASGSLHKPDGLTRGMMGTVAWCQFLLSSPSPFSYRIMLVIVMMLLVLMMLSIIIKRRACDVGHGMHLRLKWR